jgi:hypothetical protein
MSESIPNRVVVDAQTGETQVIPLTAQEIADLQVISAEIAERRAIEDAERAAAEAARESARAKLAALGLTEAEVAALVK